jgi:hypothetical protein
MRNTDFLSYGHYLPFVIIRTFVRYSHVNINTNYFTYFRVSALHLGSNVQNPDSVLRKHISAASFLCFRLLFNKAPRHERLFGEWRYNSTHSLTSALDGGEWSASRPGRFTARKTAPGTHWLGGWVGLRAVLDTALKRKTPSPRRESNPDHPIVQPVASRYTDWAIPALTVFLVIWE